jgi:Carboxypeptidase regulatory-like domain/TonB dependent receptor-like, beta-barrel
MPSRLSSSIALAVVFSTVALSAQGTSVLRGRVTDPQSAVVAGATITVTIDATGAKRTTTSDADGGFTVAELPPGIVNVEVAANGFATQLFEHVSIGTGQIRDLDVSLPVAGLREQVTVDASALSLVDTATSSVDHVIAREEISSLPLNGRNFLELALLVPGNTSAPNFDPTKTNSVLISSAGQLGRGGNVTIDGADNNDDVVGGPLENLPQDAVQEFQMATARYSAELGRSASSTINVVTRSGTNQLRGEGSIFFRDSALQGLPATFDRANPDPPFDRQQYAISGGGPIKEGVFWYGALEYRDQDGGILVGTRDLATRTISRTFAAAPLDDLLALGRVDWAPNGTHHLTVRYGGERANDVASSARDRAIGSASQRQESLNKYHNVLGTWTWVRSETAVNALSVSEGTFDNHIDPLGTGPQQTFPSFLDGSSFRVPQGTTQNRFEIADGYTQVLGSHTLRFGGGIQWIDGKFDLDVFRAGRIEYIQDFPAYDANGDGRVNDDDTFFEVTLRSGHPDKGLVIDDADNTHFGAYIQDDWRVLPRLTINAGLRYEVDTDVKNISRYDEINPIVKPFLQGDRDRDLNNLAPRIGFNWAAPDGRTSVTGGYGIYYDRITLEIESLERGLDGRALPIEVRAGNVFFIDPSTGQFPPFAPTTSNPFTGFILPGAGAGGINIIDNTMQNPTVQQFSLGVERQFGKSLVVRANGIHAHGTQFIIGRRIGEVFNPVVGGPDQVVNLESSVGTNYDALLLSAERRDSRSNLRVAYTLGKALNYANDDQIPFSNGPIDPNDLQREYGPTPNDRRHQFTLAGSWSLPYRFQISTIWSLGSGVPMDILLPGAQSRIPIIQRNAGNRQFKDAGAFNAFIRDLNASGGIAGVPLPLVGDGARFGDSLNSVDARVMKTWTLGPRSRIDGIVEVFNIFNVTNVLGVSTSNYSGFSNVLVRDSQQPGDPGFLTSSSFGRAVTTAGGVFGTGGPRAFQLAVRASF